MTSTRCWSCWTDTRVPPLDARAKARLAAAAVRAGALRSVPRAPAAELRPRGRRHSRDRDRRAVTHHYDVSNEFFRAPPRRVDDLLVRDLLARRADARTRRSAQSSSSYVQSSASAPASVCSMSAAGGAASRCTPRASTASMSPASRCPSRRRRSRASGRPRRARRPDRDPRRRLPRPRRRAVRRDRLDRHGRARRQRQHRRLRSAARSGAAARRTAAEPRHRAASSRRPRGRAVLGAFRVPRRGTAARLAGARRRSRRPAWSRRTSRVSGSTTRGRSASGRATSTSTPGAPKRWWDPSGCGSGGCTCVPLGEGSRTASRRSSRSWPAALSKSPPPAASGHGRRGATVLNACAGPVPR